MEDNSNLSDVRHKYIFNFIDLCMRDYKVKKIALNSDALVRDGKTRWTDK
jgi:hypothetical protein